jgi:hypothetical protein
MTMENLDTTRQVEGERGRLIELDTRSAEPILTRAVLVPLVAELFALAASFGFELDKAQSTTLQAVVVSVALLVGGWLARRKAFSGRTVNEVLDRQLEQVTRP